eukprot:CAMPEP_0183336558 /NCGR_PEP_ID=MMETSP0164_2-20130417/4501_1 /TAXON_ID=221442 /ORGANISM="Coccolithus pelagicus ssp braarudi, Strain PLY182g" /LENGTH=180 /DNA_ID=CAMNT_0025506099 /DNA_START=50 /DNA_END=592 /DNA_ORIENTATION=+
MAWRAALAAAEVDQVRLEAAPQIIRLVENAADDELPAVALALESSLGNVKQRLGQTWHQHKGAKRPGQRVYHPSFILKGSRRDLTQADRDLPTEVFVERFGAKVGDRVTRNPEWAASRQGRYGNLGSSGSRGALAMRPMLGIIVSLDDDHGTKVSVQWEDGQLSRGLSCGKDCEWNLVYA